MFDTSGRRSPIDGTGDSNTGHGNGGGGGAGNGYGCGDSNGDGCGDSNGDGTGAGDGSGGLGLGYGSLLALRSIVFASNNDDNTLINLATLELTYV